MATLIDLLRQLGDHAAPDGSNALVGPIVLPGVSDSPLTLSQPSAAQLVTAWSRLVRRTTLGHHALALSAAQTNYSVALMGHGSAPHDDLLLLLLAQLQGRPQRAGLCIVPHEQSEFAAKLTKLADTLGLSWLDATHPSARIRPATLVLTTPNELHRRILRFHDRAWRWLWPQLHVVALPELHQMAGAAAGHLHWVLRRAARLRPEASRTTPLLVLSSLAPVAEAEATLARLLPEEIHHPLRVIAAPDGPSYNTLIALWRCGNERVTPITRLVQQLSERRVPVAVLGRDAAETQQLHATLTAAGIQPTTDGARVAIVSGVPATSAARQTLLRAGYRLVLLLAGDDPHELLYASQPELLLQTLPYWPLALNNSYISAAQLVCAAAERPIEEAEIDRWRLRTLRDRLLKKGTLQPLPGSDLWHSPPESSDPYAKLDLRTIGEPPALIHAPDGQIIGSIAPALLDRQALPRQIFAPGLRVATRDEQTGVVQLRDDTSGAATIVLAHIGVTVREEQAARTLHFGKITADLTKGKVLATQQIVGLRELRPDGTEQRLPLRSIAEAQWSAAACWVDLPLGSAQSNGSSSRSAPRLREPDGQTAGWSITAVLPLITLAPPGSMIVSYNAEQQRLYLIEAEPGGVGLINGVYDQFERIIQLAIQLTIACASRPLYARVAASEAIWLRSLSAVPTPAAATPTLPQPTVSAAPAQPVAPPAEDAAPTVAPGSNILPFPTRRPAQRPASSAERPAASIAEAAQQAAAPAAARIYAGQRPVPAEIEPPAATPTRPAASVAKPSGSPPPKSAPARPTPMPLAPSTSQRPSNGASAITPRLIPVADEKTDQAAVGVPIEPPSTAAQADETPVLTAPIAPARHHATIYHVPEQPPISDEPERTVAHKDDRAPAVTEPATPQPEQVIAPADNDYVHQAEPVAPHAEHLVASETAEHTDQAEPVVDDEEQRRAVVTLVEPGVQEPFTSLDHESVASADDKPAMQEIVVSDDNAPFVQEPLIASEEAASQAADRTVEDDEPVMAPPVVSEEAASQADDRTVEDDEAVVQQPVVSEALEPVVAQPVASTAAALDADDDYTIEDDAAEVDDDAVEDDAAEVVGSALAPVPVADADDQPEASTPPRTPEVQHVEPAVEHTEAQPEEAAIVRPSQQPAPVTPQPAEDNRAPTPRRWQSAASRQFDIDDLLPPLPPEADDEEADAPEPEPIEVMISSRATVTPDEDFDMIDQPAPERSEAAIDDELDAPDEEQGDQPALEPIAPAIVAPTPVLPEPVTADNDERDADAAIITLDSDDDFDDFNARPRRAPATPDQAAPRTPPARSDDQQPRREQRPWRETRQPSRPNLHQRPTPQRPSEPPTDRGSAPSSGRTSGSGGRSDAYPPQPPERERREYDSRRPERQAGQPPAARGRPSEPDASASRSPIPPRQPARSTPGPTRAPEPEPAADVGAMIDRMRRLRQQREAEQQPTPRKGPTAGRESEADATNEPVELRFHIGERVQCLPYGVGIVRASRIAEGRELVQIEFPDYGEIEVDPAVSLVRQLGARPPTPDTDDESESHDM